MASHRGPAPRSAPVSEMDAPQNARMVLLALIVVAAVANLNLLVANVALPTIGAAFDASQIQLNLVAVAYSLGLASSVLWFGAIGDRYGRKRMLLIGLGASVPASLIAAAAGSIELVMLGRLLGGLAAGMAYPTTLALITALWSGPGRTKAIALWSAAGGAVSALGPVVAGMLLEWFDWRSVFLVTIPLALVAYLLAWRFVPAHVNETAEPVDHIGGVLSVIVVGAAVLAINFAPDSSELVLTLTLFAIAAVALVVFVWRQRLAASPLYDLRVARRRIFWVAAVAGIIVFGSLMGSMFIGQQFLQNVLGYSAIEAGLAVVPGAVLMVLVAPRSAQIVETHGARFTLLLGYAFILAGFVAMLVLWGEGIDYWRVGLAIGLMGIGVGLAGTPASHSLTGSVPVTRAGMASGTADLQRDLGGAIMQSIFGALLTAGYAASVAASIGAAPNGDQINASVETQLQKSYASAVETAQQYPDYSAEIIAGAQESFLKGDDWAYAAGIVAVLIGGALVFFKFPKREEERALLAAYQAQDMQAIDDLAGRTPRPAAG